MKKVLYGSNVISTEEKFPATTQTLSSVLVSRGWRLWWPLCFISTTVDSKPTTQFHFREMTVTDYNAGEISDLMFWTHPQTLSVNRCHWASEFKSQRGVRWGVCTRGERGEKSQTKTNPFLATVHLLEIWGQRKWISLVSLIHIAWSELSTSEILGWLIATGWPDSPKGTLLN